jgi:hypothetical protein
MRDGTAAKLGGRFAFDESDGSRQSIKIYYVDEDKPYSPEKGNYTCLTPTSAWAHDMGTESFKRHARAKLDGIIVHKDVWEKIRIAEEIENYDYSTDRWISNLDSVDPQPAKIQTAETVDKQDTDKQFKKEKKMSDETGTMGMIGKAALDGVKLAGANQANEAIAKYTIKGIRATGLLPDDFLESEPGRLLVKFLGPVLLHYFAQTQSEMIDNLITEGASTKIRDTCKLATQAVTAETIEPLLMFLVPLLKGLATGGLDSLMREDSYEKSNAAGSLSAPPKSDVVKDVLNTTAKEKVPA